MPLSISRSGHDEKQDSSQTVVYKNHFEEISRTSPVHPLCTLTKIARKRIEYSFGYQGLDVSPSGKQITSLIAGEKLLSSQSTAEPALQYSHTVEVCYVLTKRIQFLATQGIVAFALVICSASQATKTSVVDSCAVLRLLTPEKLASVRDEFLANHTDKYTIQVMEPPIRDQCNYGGCWAYATVGTIEQQIIERTGKKIDLSEQFMIAHNLREKIKEAFDDPSDTVTAGEHLASAEGLIRRHGIVPQDVWKPRIAFENSPHSKRMLYFINSRIARYHLETANLDDSNPIKFASRTAAENEVNQIVDLYFGVLPKEFEYGGKKYSSPLEFASEFVPPGTKYPVKVKPKREALPAGLRDEDDRPKKTGSASKPRNSGSKPDTLVEDYEQLEKRIVESLVNGKVVPISFESVYEFWDRKNGIMSISAFPAPTGFQVPSMAYRDRFDLDNSTHAVDIVGVDLDQNGKVIKFLIRNSWGTNHGDAGHDHMYRDYFRAFLSYAYFR